MLFYAFARVVVSRREHTGLAYPVPRSGSNPHRQFDMCTRFYLHYALYKMKQNNKKLLPQYICVFLSYSRVFTPVQPVLVEPSSKLLCLYLQPLGLFLWCGSFGADPVPLPTVFVKYCTHDSACLALAP